MTCHVANRDDFDCLERKLSPHSAPCTDKGSASHLNLYIMLISRVPLHMYMHDGELSLLAKTCSEQLRSQI